MAPMSPAHQAGEHSGRHAAGDDVGKRVELGAQLARHAEHPGAPSIESVEDGGHEDGDRRGLEVPVDRQRQPGDARGEVAQVTRFAIQERLIAATLRARSWACPMKQSG